MRRRGLLFVFLFALGCAVLATALTQPLPSARAEDSDTPEYISQKGCKKCHFRQHKSWKKTVHAKTLDPLKPGEKAEEKKKAGLDPEKDYTKDPKCLKCHVTGYEAPGGYPAFKAEWSENEAKLAKNNAGVGCESCHGAGSLYGPYKGDNEEYARAEVVKLGLITPVTAANCTDCHNKDNPTVGDDYVFDFEAAKADEAAVHAHTDLQYEH